MQTKGFTLIELLIVIAIVAILSTVVILALNPAELLRQARDSNRISDMATLKTAINQYLADVSNPALDNGRGYGNCYMSLATTTGFTTSPFCGGFTTVSGASATTSRTVDGNGWLPVKLNAISAGSPVSALPLDPVNATSTAGTYNHGYFFYRYAATTSPNLAYVLQAELESTKFASTSATDGGTTSTIYEVGTVSGLSL